MTAECSRAASPLAQAEERISKRVLKNPIDMGYKGPAECSRSASPQAQAEERMSNSVLRNPIDMCYKGPAER